MTDHSDATHIWHSKDFDFPCTPTGEEWSEDAKIFVRVQTPDGNTSIVSKDELIERAEDIGFLTCDLDRCRPGIGRALRASLRELMSGKPTISVVMAPRYGKSHFIRQLSIELIERDIASACIALGPWRFLRDQLNDTDKIKDMVRHHAISRPKVIAHDVLSGSLDPEFYKVTPRRHWWSLTMSQAHAPKTRTILCDLAIQFKHEKRPLVVFIDESHLTSIGDYGWGKLAAELKAAGAVLILLTGTPERADNIAPFGFRTEEVNRADLQYKTFKKINDEQTKIDFFEAEKVHYRVIPDVPMVGLQQAWKEKALTKLQHRFFAFKTDGELVTEIASGKVRRALGTALRDPETIRFAVREMLDELRLRRQTDGNHGTSAPTTAAIIFVGNDRSDDDGNDWHARAVKRVIVQEWSSSGLPGKPKIQITTRNTEDDDSEKAATAIKTFVDGDGDIIIVKQMGGVGLDAPRLKVGLDLSIIRTKSNTTQRWLRLATLWEDVTHGTMILPNDPITTQLWQDIVEEQGGQYSIENATLVDSKIVETKPKEPDSKPIISDQQRAGSIDQSLRLVEADLDQKLDAIFAKSPIFAIRFTRRELADEYEKGLFRDIVLDDAGAEPPPLVTIFDATAEVDKKIGRINEYCKQLANHGATYIKDDPGQAEIWINHFRRRMSEAKNYAGIRGELKTCRDINKLTNAEAWLEAQLDRQ